MDLVLPEEEGEKIPSAATVLPRLPLFLNETENCSTPRLKNTTDELSTSAPEARARPVARHCFKRPRLALRPTFRAASRTRGGSNWSSETGGGGDRGVARIREAEVIRARAYLYPSSIFLGKYPLWMDLL